MRVAEIEAEKLRKNAELPDLTGLPILRVADRCASETYVRAAALPPYLSANCQTPAIPSHLESM